MATQAKAKWSWRGILRHFIARPTPYWRKRLEDDQEKTEWPLWAELAVWQVFHKAAPVETAGNSTVENQEAE